MKQKPANARAAQHQNHPVPAPLMDTLIETVAADAGVDASLVRIKKAEAVTWRDGSLGCPEPGMAYSQALIEGYLVVLSADQQDFDMRVTSGGRYSRCLNSKKPTPLRDSEL